MSKQLKKNKKEKTQRNLKGISNNLEKEEEVEVIIV